MKIEMSDTTEVTKYEQECHEILLALGINRYLITDRSQLADFSPNTFDKVEELLCRDVSGDEYIWKLARELREDDRGY